MSEYGDAVFHRHDDGTVTVEHADPVIGISLALLADLSEDSLPVDDEGCVWLAGNPQYRYRPVRFARTANMVGPIGAGLATGCPDVLVCERVDAG